MADDTRGWDRVLLTEGQDDKHVIWQVCHANPTMFDARREDYQLSVTVNKSGHSFLLAEKGGVNELLDSLSVELDSPGRSVLGVVVDADSQVAGRWTELTKALADHVILPSSLQAGGTIQSTNNGQVKLGVWVMPNNGSSGEIEDFVVAMVNLNDVVWPLASDFIKDVPTESRKFNDLRIDKAILYAWLATKREPGRMGAAVGSGELDLKGQEVTAFTLWLDALYG